MGYYHTNIVTTETKKWVIPLFLLGFILFNIYFHSSLAPILVTCCCYYPVGSEHAPASGFQRGLPRTARVPKPALCGVCPCAPATWQTSLWQRAKCVLSNPNPKSEKFPTFPPPEREIFMTVTVYNKATYSALLSELVKVSDSADKRANFFVPMAFAALIDGDKQLSNILDDLCGSDAEAKLGLRVTFRTSTGKVAPSALPVASKKAFDTCASIWKQCERTNDLGEACLQAVKGFIGYLDAEAVAERDLLWEARLAELAEKGQTKGTGEAAKALFYNAYVTDLYPNRAANLAQLQKAIKAINDKAAEAEAAIKADEKAKAEAEAEAALLTPEAIAAQNEANRLELIAAQAASFANASRFLADMSVEFINAHDEALTELLANIGAAFARRNAEAEAEAAPMAEAA